MPDIFNAREENEHRHLEDAEVAEAAESTGDDFVVTNPENLKTKPPLNPDQPHRPVEEYSEVMRVEQASSNPFDAFAPKPLHIFFDSQDKAEKIILLLRKHPITQVRWVVIAVGFALLPLLFGSLDMFSAFPARFRLAGLILWYLLLIGYSMESFLTWFFNVYIVTDERIIDVDFLSLIYKNISAAKIDNIEDVTAETGGAIRSIFNFGTVHIQTAGTKTELEFEDVPQPSKVTRLINELLLEEEREKVEGRVN